jgi:hypothetical protein
VVATLGVLTVAVVAAVPRWTGEAHRTVTVTSLQLLLRDAQQRAIGDGHSMCVDARTWTVLRGACGPERDGVTFFADGTATPGAFQVGLDTVAVDSSGSSSAR